MLEQEIKLAYDSPEAARRAVLKAGGRLEIPRRLIVDRLFDTNDARLRAQGTTCRLRREPGQTVLTFKGPTQPGRVKTREETETTVADPDQMERILGLLGYAPCFTAEKYREEYRLGPVLVTVDETPVGAFIEIEGTPEAIDTAARHLDRSPADYRLESYPRLYAAWCADHGRPVGDMLFG